MARPARDVWLAVCQAVRRLVCLELYQAVWPAALRQVAGLAVCQAVRQAAVCLELCQAVWPAALRRAVGQAECEVVRRGGCQDG
jgi:hypothetical protein